MDNIKENLQKAANAIVKKYNEQGIFLDYDLVLIAMYEDASIALGYSREILKDLVLNPIHKENNAS